jgi:hypothetical protein
MPPSLGEFRLPSTYYPCMPVDMLRNEFGIYPRIHDSNGLVGHISNFYSQRSLLPTVSYPRGTLVVLNSAIDGDRLPRFAAELRPGTEPSCHKYSLRTLRLRPGQSTGSTKMTQLIFLCLKPYLEQSSLNCCLPLIEVYLC